MIQDRTEVYKGNLLVVTTTSGRFFSRTTGTLNATTVIHEPKSMCVEEVLAHLRDCVDQGMGFTSAAA